MSLISFFLSAGSLVIGVVMVSRRCRVNPDNIATPIAGSLGDLTTILILAAISSALSKNLGMFWQHKLLLCKKFPAT